MIKEKEYALLDADFIIKANISRKAEDNRLLDWLASDTRYQLVCHEMALAEVSVHDNCGASPWLKKAIASGIVRQFTDKDIICELYGMYNVAGIELYRQFLEESCNSMNSSFYDTYYPDVRDFDLSIEHNGKQYIKGAVFSENLNDDVKYRTLAQQCDFDAS